jgi:ribosomal protein S7
MQKPSHLKDALANVMPHVEVRRVGGATFQIQCKLDQTEKFYGNEVVNTLFKKKK